MDDRKFNNDGTEVNTAAAEIPAIKPPAPKSFNWNKLAVVFILIGAAFLGIGGMTGTSGRGLYFSNGQLHVHGINSDAAFLPIPDGAQVTGVAINGSSVNVVIEPTPRGETDGVHFFNIEDYGFEINAAGELVINTRSNSSSGFYVMSINTPREEILINLPADILDSIYVNCTSGNIRINGMNTDTITVNANSGNIRLDNLQAGSIHTRVTSGNIRFENINFTGGTLEANSGNIRLENVNWQNLNAKTTSGTIRVDGRVADTSAGETNINANSGNVILDMRGNKSDFSYALSTSSGTARIDGENLGSHTSISSNSFETAFSNLTANSGYHRINIRTTSGNARLNFN